MAVRLFGPRDVGLQRAELFAQLGAFLLGLLLLAAALGRLRSLRLRRCNRTQRKRCQQQGDEVSGRSHRAYFALP